MVLFFGEEDEAHEEEDRQGKPFLRRGHLWVKNMTYYGKSREGKAGGGGWGLAKVCGCDYGAASGMFLMEIP